MKQLAKHIAPRDIPNNFILNPEHSFLSFILPEYGENLYYRGALAADDWHFIGEDLPIETSNIDPLYTVFHYDVDADANDVIYKRNIESLESNKIYTFSFWAKRVSGGNTFKFFIGSSDTAIPLTFAVRYGFTEKELTTHWSSYEVSFYTNTVSSSSYYYVIEFDEDTHIYMDGFQLEQKPYRTTYMNGDLSLINNEDNYSWAGQANNSITIREAATNAGKIVSFNEIGFNLVAMEGFGLPDFNHSTTKLPVNPIQVYEGSQPDQRDIKLDFVIYASNVIDLLKQRSLLIQQLKTGMLHIYIQLFDCDKELTTIYETTLLYEGGAQLDLNSLYGSKFSLDFTTFDPYLYRIGTNAKIFYPLTRLDADLTVFNGNSWDTINSPISNTNEAGKKTLIGPNNAIYLLRNAPAINEGFLFKHNYTNDTWTTVLISGASGQTFNDMIIGPNNEIYIGGDFDNVKLASTNLTVINSANANLLRYNVYNNTAIRVGTISNAGGGAVVYRLYLMSQNRLFVGGHFDTVSENSGNPTYVYTYHMAIYSIDSGRFTNIYNGRGLTDLTGSVRAVIEYNNSLYIGGIFSEPEGKNILRIEGLDRRSLYRTAMQLNYVTNPSYIGPVYDMALARNGDIYITGQFSNIGPNFSALPHVSNYNVGLTPISLAKIIPSQNTITGIKGGLLDFELNTIGIGYDLEIDNAGILWIVGRFDYYGPIDVDSEFEYDSTPISTYMTANNLERNCSSVATYNTYRNEWVVPTLIYDFNNKVITDILIVNTELFKPLADVTRIITARGLLTNSNGINVFIDEGSSPVFPIIILSSKYNDRILGIDNNTTGKSLYLDKTLLTLEQYTIDLRGLIPEVFSTYYGKQNGQLLFGSNSKLFVLVPGENYLTLLFKWATTVTSGPEIIFYWKNKYLSMDFLVSELYNEYQ